MDQQVTISPPEFQIIEREAFTVLGVEEEFALIERDDPGFVKIWLERFEAQHELVRSLSLDKAYYGIFFYASESVGRPARYLAGMRVAHGAETPADWVVREISAATIRGLRGNVGANRRCYRPRAHALAAGSGL